MCAVSETNCLMLDDLVRPFEQAWASGEAPSLATAIQTLPPGRDRIILWELVAIDMEFRWRKSQRPSQGLPSQPRWRDYLAVFPSLGTLSELPPEYVAEEYRLRTVWGDAPRHDHFIAAFPSQLTLLVPILKSIDAELRAEQIADAPHRCGEN